MIKKHHIIASIILLFCAEIHAQSWTLLWEDEFNSTTLDSNYWSHDIGSGSQFNLYGWGNSELQYYQPQNTSISNGILTIEARVEPTPLYDSWNVPYNYSSSKIVTRNKFEFKYGKVEARIKTVDGEGFWPAFWMMPSSGCWPENGEIDIMEQWGNDGPTNVTTGAAHVGVCGSGSYYDYWNHTIPQGSFADDFHVYGVIWAEDYIGWYLDGQLMHSVTPSSYPQQYNWPFNDLERYVMINFAIDSNGPNGNTIFPNNIQVDYVRVYQTNDIIGCMDQSASNYNSAATVSGPCDYEVTFNVNMNCYPNSYNTVYLTGPFNGWCGDCDPMTDSNNDGIWSLTKSFSGNNVEYKYSVDNWSDQEDLVDDMQNGASCAPITDYWGYANRIVDPTINNVTNDSWGSCTDCFTTIDGCTDANATNYNPLAATDDGSCVFPVTFTVDMNCYADAFTTVYVTGPFAGWCGDCFPLSDADGDGVWEGTYDFAAGDLEYKYNVDNWAHQEDLIDDMQNGASCAPVTDYWSFANRSVTVAGATVTDDNYDSCDDCIVVYGCTDSEASNYNPAATTDDGTCVFAVNFTVDMNCSGILFNTVYITGPFAGWCGDCFPLSDVDGDGIWNGIYNFPLGDLEYKYEVDNWTHQEDLIDDMQNGASCAPITDYWGYANRIVTVSNSINSTDDNYGSCDDCVAPVLGCLDPLADNYDPNATVNDGSCTYAGVLGCTDATASNYDSAATTDDGSCVFPVTFTVDMNCYPDAFTTVYVTGPVFGWCGNCFPLSDADGDGVWEGTYDFATGDLEYKYALDNWAYQENLVDDMLNGASCAPVTDYSVYANRLITIATATVTDDNYGSCDDCVPVVLGCTDPQAPNYNPQATQDDGSCSIASICSTPTGLNTYDVVHTRATFNFNSTGADYYKIRVKVNGGSWQVITQLGTATGTPGGSTKTKYFLTADASYEWQVRAWCIDGQVSGWSSSAFFNTLPECPNATNQYASDIEAEWAVLNWDAPTNTVAGVNYYLARIQEQGASSWNIVSPGNGGTDNFKLKGQLTPGATYNFETRTWCNTGDSNNPTDPYYKSDWGGMVHFQTIPCPVQTFNLYTSNVNATTQFFGADFIADGSVPYDHFTLRFREVGATAWTFRSITAAHIAAGGRNVGALTTGAEYEWGIRTFCGTGSTWKSPWESGPNFVAGSSARLAAPVTALEVYPNPSRDIFNVSFTSEEAQTINVKVVNVIGEVMYSESMEEFKGSYEQGIDLTAKAKGVYFLEITTNTGGINKKIALQ